MGAAPIFLEHPSSLAHDTGGHPEQAARLVTIARAMEARGWLGYERVSSPEVARETLTAIHPPEYVAAIERVAASGGAHLDPDTVVSEGSFDAALHASGGAVALVERLLDGSAPVGFSAHRPPGHHAEPTRPMGFCLFNNVAVAARHALDALEIERVLILDWDVHHGNGTNDIFHSEAAVLFISIHQSPLYPGTGASSDVGSDAGQGFTVNLPVPPGSGDPEYRSLVDHVAVPLVRAFQPQLVLISAGYDAHSEDPLADCRVTDAGYAAMARSMRAACDELGVPVGAVLEGGYALGALGRSVVATLEALAGSNRGSAVAEDALPVAPLARQAVARLSPWWPGLA
jgi:acetoin utilization deacetylase AcuC-like enzyme